MYLGYLLNKNHSSKKLLPEHFANYYSGKNAEIAKTIAKELGITYVDTKK